MKKNHASFMDCLRTALPIAVAATSILVSAGYLIYRAVSAYKYNERWKDYDECGLS